MDINHTQKETFSTLSTRQKLGAWPEECEELYTKIKPLGKGGFSIVWLAQSRNFNKEDVNPNLSLSEKHNNEYIAIKLIHSSTKVENVYANREIQVLKEIHHPFITKLVDVIELKPIKKDGRLLMPPFRCIALSYERGPTLEHLIHAGGALGIPFNQLIFKQLVSAVSYMHSRAVMHRDIKPDNIIVNGADLLDDTCWSNGEETRKAIIDNKWHVKLIDFGFARALTPEQVKMGNRFLKRSIEGCKKGDEIALKASKETEEISVPVEDNLGRNEISLDTSISTKQIMDLSALGNRKYAAPEIIRTVKKSITKKTSGTWNERRKPFETIAENVSDYGMTADAFSFGATLHHALTGVSPGIDVNEYVAMRNSPLSVSMRKIGKMTNNIMNRKKNKIVKRKKQFRTYDDLPKEAAMLVRGLTKPNPMERTTVRAAEFYPWFRSDDNENRMHIDHIKEPCYKHEINHLKCSIVK